MNTSFTKLNTSTTTIIAKDYTFKTLLSNFDWKSTIINIFTGLNYDEDDVFMISTGLSSKKGKYATLSLKDSIPSFYQFCEDSDKSLKTDTSGLYLLDWICIAVYISVVTLSILSLYGFYKNDISPTLYLLCMVLLVIVLFVFIYMQINLHSSQDVDNSSLDYYINNIVGLQNVTSADIDNISFTLPSIRLGDINDTTPCEGECDKDVQTITFDLSVNWNDFSTSADANIKLYCNPALVYNCLMQDIQLEATNIKSVFKCELKLCKSKSNKDDEENETGNCIKIDSFKIIDQSIDAGNLTVNDIGNTSCPTSKRKLKNWLNIATNNIQDTKLWDVLAGILSDELNNLIKDSLQN